MKPSCIITFALLIAVAPPLVLAEELVNQIEPPRDEDLAMITSMRSALDEAMRIDSGRLSTEELAVARRSIVERASELVETLENIGDRWLVKKEYLRYGGIATYARGVEGVLARREAIDHVTSNLLGLDFDARIAEDFPGLAIQTTVLRVVLESNLVAGAIAALPYCVETNTACAALLHFAQRATSPAGKILAQMLSTNPITPRTWVGAARNIASRKFGVGQPFEFRLSATDGSDVDSSDLRGKVLLVDFWATTCAPSMQSLPELKSLYERYHDRGLEIFGVNQDDDTEPVFQVLRQRMIPWPTHLDTGGVESGFTAQCGIFAIPNIWLVDRRGVLREMGVDSDLEAKIKLLLNEPP